MRKGGWTRLLEIIDDSYFLSCHKTSKESSIKSSLSLVDERFALLIRILLNKFVPATKFWFCFLDPSSWALRHKSGEADNLHGLDSTSKTQKRTQKEKTKSILFVIFHVSFLFLMYGSPYWCLAVLYRCWSVSCLPATVAIVASATKVQPIWFTEQGFPNSYTHLLLRLNVDLSNMFEWNICPSSWNSVLSMYWTIRFVRDHISEALCLGRGKLRTSDDHFEDKKIVKSLLSLLSLLQLLMLKAKTFISAYDAYSLCLLNSGMSLQKRR